MSFSSTHGNYFLPSVTVNFIPNPKNGALSSSAVSAPGLCLGWWFQVRQRRVMRLKFWVSPRDLTVGARGTQKRLYRSSHRAGKPRKAEQTFRECLPGPRPHLPSAPLRLAVVCLSRPIVLERLTRRSASPPRRLTRGPAPALQLTWEPEDTSEGVVEPAKPGYVSASCDGAALGLWTGPVAEHDPWQSDRENKHWHNCSIYPCPLSSGFLGLTIHCAPTSYKLICLWGLEKKMRLCSFLCVGAECRKAEWMERVFILRK